MTELDLTNRDPNQLNNHIQVMYDDILAEPEGAHSLDCVWTNSYKCFNCGLNCCYKLLSTIFGIFLALGWGCAFAFITFSEVWLVTPFIRALNIVLTNVRKIFSITLNTFFAPWYEVVGLVFSRIHITNSTGPAPKPLDFMPQGPSSVKHLK